MSDITGCGRATEHPNTPVTPAARSGRFSAGGAAEEPHGATAARGGETATASGLGPPQIFCRCAGRQSSVCEMHTFEPSEPSTSTRAILRTFNSPAYITLGDPYEKPRSFNGRDHAYKGRQFQTTAPKAGLKGARNQASWDTRRLSQRRLHGMLVRPGLT